MTKRRRWYTTGQVADLFGVVPETVRRWANEGEIPCVRTVGRNRRFDADQIDALTQAK